MQNTKITSRYAKALYTTAMEMNLLDKASQDMQLVYDVCSSSAEFMKMMISPVIRGEKKKNVIDAIFGEKINKITLLFIHIIIKQGREEYIMDIAQAFTGMYKEYKGIKTVYLSTATTIDDDIRKRLKNTIGQQTRYEIELVEQVDNELIGGFLVKMDHTQYDATIANKLRKLEKELKLIK